MAVFDKLINAYKRSNKIEEARSAIERARKLLGRNDIFADRELVSLYRESGDRRQALAAVRNARTREPQDVTLLRLEATLLMETGQVNEAVELIKKRITSGKIELPIERLGSPSNIAPRLDDDFSNYIFISQLFNDAGRGADAAAAAEQAYGVAGSEERKQIASLMIATSKQTSGQYAEAETILRSILQSSPRNPIALNNLGYFFVERGENLQEALDLIQRAIAIDPTNPSYLDSLGWAYFKLGRTDEAIRQLEEAARLDDTSATIHEHLGDAYRQKGKLEQARTAWQRAAVLTSGPSDTARIKEKLDNAK
jgi:tetratricopeptide (TPR) repeat protein